MIVVKAGRTFRFSRLDPIHLATQEGQGRIQCGFPLLQSGDLQLQSLDCASRRMFAGPIFLIEFHDLTERIAQHLQQAGVTASLLIPGRCHDRCTVPGCIGKSEFCGATDETKSRATLERALELVSPCSTLPTCMGSAPTRSSSPLIVRGHNPHQVRPCEVKSTFLGKAANFLETSAGGPTRVSISYLVGKIT